MTGPDPRVAVVMITYNRRDEVQRTLARLTGLPEKPRIVVVDNGSTDDTAEAVAERFAEVALLRAGRNLGAAGRTLGVRRVTTPYIAFCDDDSWWRPGDLSRAADLFGPAPPAGRDQRPHPRRSTSMCRSRTSTGGRQAG